MTHRFRISTGALSVILLLAAAAVIRDVYILQYRALPYYHVPALDAEYYDQWAMRIIGGHWYGPTPFYMAPLYPYFLAAVYTLFGHVYPLVYALQQLLGLVSLTLVYAIGRRVFGHVPALVAVVLLILYGPLMHLESKLLTETLGIALTLTSLLLVLRAMDRQSAGGFIVAGVAIGLTALCRPSSLIFAGVLLIWLVIRRRQPKHAILLAFGLVLAVIPVTVRNCVVGKGCALISTNGGIVFAQGNHVGANGLEMPLPGFTTAISTQQREEMRIASRELGRPVTPVESQNYWFGQGLRFIREHPGEWAMLEGKKLLWALHNREAGVGYNVLYERRFVPILGLLILPFAVLSGFGLYGFFLARSGGPRPDVEILALNVGSGLLGLLLFSVSSRYRMPMVPVLAVAAGLGVTSVADKLRNRDWQSLAGAALVIAPMFLVSLVPYPLPPILPGDPGNLGVAYAQAGDMDSAVRCFREALEMNPKSSLAHLNLGSALIRQAKPGEAAAVLRRGLLITPKDARLHGKLGDALMMMGMKEKAAAEYRAAARLSVD